MTRRVVLALLLARRGARSGRARRDRDRYDARPLPNAVHSEAGPAQLTEKRVTAIFLGDDKVADWLDRYPTRTSYDGRDLRQGHGATGASSVWSGSAGEIATGRVDDATGAVTEAWTGPQVAWKMARGYDGRVRRQEDQQPPGLARASARSSCSGSPTCGGRCRCATSTCSCCSRSRSRSGSSTAGDIFTSVPLAYPPLALPARARRSGSALARRAPSAARPVWPVWLLARRDRLPRRLPRRPERARART